MFKFKKPPALRGGPNFAITNENASIRNLVLGRVFFFINITSFGNTGSGQNTGLTGDFKRLCQSAY